MSLPHTHFILYRTHARRTGAPRSGCIVCQHTQRVASCRIDTAVFSPKTAARWLECDPLETRQYSDIIYTAGIRGFFPLCRRYRICVDVAMTKNNYGKLWASTPQRHKICSTVAAPAPEAWRPPCPRSSPSFRERTGCCGPTLRINNAYRLSNSPCHSALYCAWRARCRSILLFRSPWHSNGSSRQGNQQLYSASPRLLRLHGNARHL